MTAPTRDLLLLAADPACFDTPGAGAWARDLLDGIRRDMPRPVLLSAGRPGPEAWARAAFEAAGHHWVEFDADGGRRERGRPAASPWTGTDRAAALVAAARAAQAKAWSVGVLALAAPWRPTPLSEALVAAAAAAGLPIHRLDAGDAPPAPTPTDLVVLDTETTARSHKTLQVIELAAVRCPADGSRECAAFEVRIPIAAWAQPYVEAGALAVNGYTPERWVDAAALDESLAAFEAFAGPDARLVAHNATFDMNALRAMYARLRRTWPGAWGHRIIDTLRIARTMVKRGLVPNAKLETLCGRYGLGAPAHQALADARALRAILPALWREAGWLDAAANDGRDELENEATGG